LLPQLCEVGRALSVYDVDAVDEALRYAVQWMERNVADSPHMRDVDNLKQRLGAHAE
jgi:hypothetical protein